MLLSDWLTHKLEHDVVIHVFEHNQSRREFVSKKYPEALRKNRFPGSSINVYVEYIMPQGIHVPRNTHLTNPYF